MTKADIIEAVYEKVGGFSKKEAAEIVETVFNVVKETLERGDLLVEREPGVRHGERGRAAWLDVQRLLATSPLRRSHAKAHGGALFGDHRAVGRVELHVAPVVEGDHAKALFAAERGDAATQ